MRQFEKSIKKNMKGIKSLKKKKRTDTDKRRFKTIQKKLYRINAGPRRSRTWFKPKLHLPCVPPFAMCSVHSMGMGIDAPDG